MLDGVHTIFDDVKPWIENLTNIVTDSGMIYVFGSLYNSFVHHSHPVLHKFL